MDPTGVSVVAAILGAVAVTAGDRHAAAHGLHSAGPLVRTGGGGWHFYLAPTGLGNLHPRDLEHVDWRGRGGYVVAPPSRHASGHPYQWLAGRDLDTPPGPVPTVLFVGRMDQEKRVDELILRDVGTALGQQLRGTTALSTLDEDPRSLIAAAVALAAAVLSVAR